MTRSPILPPGYRLVAFDDIDSTNAEAKRLAVEERAPEGAVVWARTQSAGRGRKDRQWVSEAGNLYCSILLRPSCSLAEAAEIGFVTAVAVGDAIRQISPDVMVKYKWPNDILVAEKKVAGILLESSARQNGIVDWVVVGVGINLASHPQGTEFSATSLGRHIKPSQMLEVLCTHMMRWRGQWRENGFSVIREQWLKHGHEIGDELRVRTEKGNVIGRFLGIGDNGGLELEVEGRLQRFDFGDVFFAANGN